MSRSLPLNEFTVAPDGGAPTAAITLTGSVAVYDPAMCCSTGVCGPGVDPSLLQLSRDLRWLRAHGATVERFGLGQEPQAFVANARVAGLMAAFGDGALPAVLVNGDVLVHGGYPSRDELIAALAPVSETSRDSAVERCEPGSGCC
jgi:hypothetical protein